MSDKRTGIEKQIAAVEAELHALKDVTYDPELLLARFNRFLLHALQLRGQIHQMQPKADEVPDAIARKLSGTG